MNDADDLQSHVQNHDSYLVSKNQSPPYLKDTILLNKMTSFSLYFFKNYVSKPM
jgi:hypothetical protein